MQTTSTHTSDEWNAVREAVEQALPFYESISEAISFGLAGPLRRRAIRRLESSRKDWVLDSGTGPGVSSRMMLADGFEKVVGLDPSKLLLRSTATRLRDRFYPLLGVAEHLPIRSNCVWGVITCYSLRDVRDRSSAVSEFSRITRENGRLEIVDVGKPDNVFTGRLIGLYVVLVMPLIARAMIGRKAKGNPFRMIIPTFHRLPTNQSLTRLARDQFGSAHLNEFLLGGLMIIDALRTNNSHR
jgi:demethylmenaquinone methyltransferase / 2-methoxy-6-polyprenyl-1,4-benzoquinol methylase